MGRECEYLQIFLTAYIEVYRVLSKIITTSLFQQSILCILQAICPLLFVLFLFLFIVSVHASPILLGRVLNPSVCGLRNNGIWNKMYSNNNL